MRGGDREGERGRGRERGMKGKVGNQVTKEDSTYTHT